jgi:hypothetical protein
MATPESATTAPPLIDGRAAGLSWLGPAGSLGRAAANTEFSTGEPEAIAQRRPA